MRGVALADLHLGFRQFSAMTGGRNAREVDVENAWWDAVEQVIELDPHLVTFAGDIVHHPRVSDFAKLAFLEGISRILANTGAHAVVIRGNHDAGRTADVLSPLALANVLGRHFMLGGTVNRLHLVDRPTRLALFIRGESVSVACFPFVVLDGEGTSYKLEPDPKADVNVLLMHAAVRGAEDGEALPFFYGARDQALDVGREADRWDVIALGDFHTPRVLAQGRLVFYSGSLERTSSNIWGEPEPKGFMSYETGDDAPHFHPVRQREMRNFVVDDKAGWGEDASAAGMNAMLESLVGMADLADAIVRLKVVDFPMHEREHINWALVRALKATCLHFYLDVRYAARDVTDIGDRRNREGGLSLADEAVAFFADDDEAVRRCAFRHLDIEADIEEVSV